MSTSINIGEYILDNNQGVIDPDVYFRINKPPANLPEFETKLTAFVDYHQQLNNRVVFITVIHSFLLKRVFLTFFFRVAELLFLWKIRRFVLSTTSVTVLVVLFLQSTF